MDINVILLNLGSMAAYLVILGDVIPPLFAHLVGPDVRCWWRLRGRCAGVARGCWGGVRQHPSPGCGP